MARAKRQPRGAADLAAALVAFHDETGRWPTSTELQPPLLRARGHLEALERWERLDLPHAASLIHRFGSHHDALAAARRALQARARARRKAGG